MSAEPNGPVDVTGGLLRGWPLPEPGGDKESRGRVLVLGGTASTPGAVLLAGEAVLRAGGGKLQIATAEPVAAALAVAVPEALVAPLPTDAKGHIDAAAADEVLELAEGCDTLLVGPVSPTSTRRCGCSSRCCPGCRARSWSMPSPRPSSPGTATG